MSAYQRPRPLAPGDTVEGFDSGVSSLDSWLIRYARIAVAAGSARTYVSSAGDRVAAFYAISAGEVAPAVRQERIARGVGSHPIPVVLLARLAVDRRDEGAGLGAAMLRDAIARTLQVSEEVGVRALLVSATNPAAAAFYGHFGFEPLPGDPLRLFLLQKDMRRLTR